MLELTAISLLFLLALLLFLLALTLFSALYSIACELGEDVFKLITDSLRELWQRF